MKTVSILKNAIVAGLVALFVNLGIYYIAQKLFGISFLLPARDGKGLTELPAWDIPISSFLPAILAGILFLLLARFTRKPEKIFMIVSFVVLVLSFLPLLIDTSIGVKISFALMHIFAAGIIVWFIVKRPL